jgi:mannan endo-1,4-beta-mannosidase
MTEQTLLRGALLCALLMTLAACGSSTGASSSSTSSSSTPASSPSVPAVVALASSSYVVPTSASAAVVTVERTGGSAGSASVGYSTANGTAVAGTDYTAASGTLTWATGDSAAKTISVPVHANATGKAFTVELTGVTGSAQFGAPTQATITLGTAPPTPKPTPSASGTMIPSASQLVDSAGNVWTLVAAAAYENGAPAAYSANVALLLYYGGTIYHENKSCLWWSWNGSAWVGTSNPAPSLTPACSNSAAAAASSGGSSASGSHGTAAALLEYIVGLQGQTKHILSGQHSSYWDANPLDYVQAATGQTGKTVAILGTTTGQEGSSQNAISVTNAWLAQGGIPLVSWWPLDPFTGKVDNNRGIDFAQLTQPGTAPYIAWYKLLDEQIAMLKQINGPVLYRPLVELNGNWSWWNGKDGATFVKIWQQMHDYYVSNGVTNILWVYNLNTARSNYSQYYPGSAYVDVVSIDAYPPSASDTSMYNSLIATGKPLMYAETGTHNSNNSAISLFTYDNEALLQAVKTVAPKAFAVVVFCQHWALSQQNGAAAFMNDPAVIALSDLPSGLVNP